MEKNISVKLISYSKPFDDFEKEIKSESIQDLIAYCARVSNPSNQINRETTEKLLSYLAKNKHWSPFEMVSACLEINAPRDIARQVLRHRSFSFQEFSQRYANPLDSLKWARREARMQDPKNRQNSIDLDLETEYDKKLNDEWLMQQDAVVIAATKAYKWAIDNGVAKEQARAVLPEGLVMSRMYVNGTIRSWIHYIELRSDNGTQKEHIQIAKACAEAISGIFPLVNKYGGQ